MPMTPAVAAPEWFAVTASAMSMWPTAARDEFVSFLRGRTEPALLLLASVLDEEIASRRAYSAGAS